MKLTRKFFTVGGLTIVSRILGVVRESALSYFLGACAEMDSFLIAFKFPSFFRKFFAEGGFQSVFVPYLTDFTANNKRKSAIYFSSRIFTLVFYSMLLISIIVMIFAKEFVLIMAPGFIDDPIKIDLAVEFTRIIFPSIFFVSLSTLYSSIFISNKKFFAFSIAPILVNIILIFSLFVCKDSFTAGIRISYGVLFSGIFQFLYMYIYLRYKNLTIPKISKVKITRNIKSFLSKLLPILTGAGVAQINVFIGSLFGSFLPTGSITYIYFADRFIQLPLALFGISMGIILIPEIANSISKKEKKDLNKVQNKAIVFAMRLTIPSVMILISLSYLFVSVLYGHGRFSATSIQKTADILKVFALGLPAYVVSKIISSIFFANKNSKIPVRAAIISVFVDLILSSILIFPLQEIGIALATTISGFVNAYILFKENKKKFCIDKSIILPIFKIIIASIFLFISVYFVKKFFFINNQSSIYEIMYIFLGCFIGIIVYIIMLILLKDKEVIPFIMSLKNKFITKRKIVLK